MQFALERKANYHKSKKLNTKYTLGIFDLLLYLYFFYVETGNIFSELRFYIVNLFMRQNV